MAKVRRANTAVNGIDALRSAISHVGRSERAKVDPELSKEEKSDIVNTAMDSVDDAMAIIGDSNLTTMLENSDDAIELQHQAAEEQDGVGAPDID